MIEIIQNHSLGFTRMTTRKFTIKTKVHGKKIQNEKLNIQSGSDDSNSLLCSNDNNDLQVNEPISIWGADGVFKV